MSDTLKLTLLGQPQVVRVDARGNEAPLTAWRYKKSLALLFYLAVTGRSHSREALIGLLWGDSTEANARANLRKSLSELRRLVGPVVIITRFPVNSYCAWCIKLHRSEYQERRERRKPGKARRPLGTLR